MVLFENIIVILSLINSNTIIFAENHRKNVCEYHFVSKSIFHTL